jgi:hypothetical protein
MDQRSFEFKASFPVDAQFARTVAALAEHAATYAGGGAAEAREFAAIVEQAVRECIPAIESPSLPVILRRDHGPVEVLVGSHRLTWTVARR